MSLLKTKPTWHRGEVIATERGWVNPLNNEVLVSIGNLKQKLELEFASIPKPVVEPELVVEKIESPIEQKPEIVKEHKMETKKQTNKKPKVVVETTQKTVPVGQQLIAEVVEYDLDKPIIAE